MKKEQQNIKTFTQDGKRKFKAKVLSGVSKIGQGLLGQGSAAHQARASSSTLDKMRVDKTEENYQVETSSEALPEKPQQRKVPRFKKMAEKQPGQDFKPTTEDFSQ